MQSLLFLIVKILLLTSGLAAATGNANVAINSFEKKSEELNSNPRDKRSLGLALLVSSLLQNSAPPATAAPKMPMTTVPAPPAPPAYVYNPSFGYQPHLPYLPDKNGYINFNVPDGYVLVTTPAPPAPPVKQPVTPAKVDFKLQKKQSFLNFLATLSAGAQAPAKTTTPAPPTFPPQGILIPKSAFPNYQQQLRQRVIYKYAQNDDTSSDVPENEVAAQYPYTATHEDGPPTANYYHESSGRGPGPSPVDASFYKSSHNAYEQPQFSATPEQFRISYPDDTDYYQPQPSETSHYQQLDSQEAHKQTSQEDLHVGNAYSESYGY